MNNENGNRLLDNKDNTRLAIISDNYFSDDFYQGEEAFHMNSLKKMALALYNKEIEGIDIFSTAKNFVDEFGGIVLELFPSHLKDGTNEEPYSTSVMVFTGRDISNITKEKTLRYLEMLESGYKDFHPLIIDGFLNYSTGEMYEFPSKEEIEECIQSLSKSKVR